MRAPDVPAGLSAHDVVVDGRRVRYWATPARERSLLLLHGASAHAMWWSQVVPLLSGTFRCVALDSSGHGASDRTPTYATDQWVDEVEAVAADAGLDRPDVVGHSRGGRLGVLAAARATFPGRGLVLLDSGIRPPHLHRAPSRPLDRPQRTYDSFEQARSRFRLMPPQEAPPDDVLDVVARHSLHEVDGRWTWRYDAAAPLNIDDAEVERAMPHVRVPVALGYGERSVVVTEEMVDHVRHRLRPVLVVWVPGAEHHLVLSHPHASADVVRRAVATFDALAADDPTGPR